MPLSFRKKRPSVWPIVLLLAVAAFATVSLVRGASYLGFVLPGGLPFGNALAAIGQCALAGAAVLLATRGTWRRRLALIALIAAIAWLPVSMLLAGNASLNFSGVRGTVWLWFTLVTLVLAFAVLLWNLVCAMLSRAFHA